MTARSSWLLLIVTPLALYSGMVNGEFLSLDESEFLRDLDRFSRNILNYFVPAGGAAHQYYRPVQGLTLLLDNLIWGTQASGFHLTNVLLHVANVLLVYALALKVGSGPRRQLTALLAALLFAVHPVHAESVDWIAGRTDLLATLFGLGAFLAYLRFREDQAWRYLFASAGCYLLSLFSKEVGLAVPLIIAAYELMIPHREFAAPRVRLALGAVALYGLTTGWYLLLRQAALARGDLGLAKSSGILTAPSWVDQAQAMVAALGFYAKKLVFPFPLNFAIGPVESPLYLALGLCVIGVACVAALKRSESSFWFWWILLTLGPSLVVVTTGMAWTSVAERYLYLPSVGFSILAILLLSALSVRIHRPTLALSAVVLAVAGWFFVGTYLRNLVWQEQLRLWEDTVLKSPEFPIARNEYGLALKGEKRYEEAKVQFEKAIEMGYRTKPLENLAMLAIHIDNDDQEAERLLTMAIESGGQGSGIFSSLATTYVRRAGIETQANAAVLLRKAITLYERAYERQRDPAALYRIGQVHLRLGEHEKARASFQRAIEHGGPDDFFVAPSKAIVIQLEKRSG